MSESRIKINGNKDLEWYIEDSKMSELMNWLNANGKQNNQKMDEFYSWIHDLVGTDYIKEKGNKYKEQIYFYTNEYKYEITAHAANYEGYLGGVAFCRKLFVGEDHIRGVDLPDGPLNKETWDKIKTSIISNELIKINSGSSEREMLHEDFFYKC